MQTKQCTKCGEVKGLDEFYKRKRGYLGRYAECIVCRNNRMKAYQQENRGRARLAWKKYAAKNKDKLAEYRRCRRKANPTIRLQENLRSSINTYLKGQKTKCTAEILGCSYEQFYLNLGAPPEDAHLDHIIPQSLANNKEEIYLLNHWSNFQWLPASENISKGNRHTSQHKYEQVLKNHPEPNKIRAIVNRSKNEGFQVLSETLKDEAL